MLFPILVIDLAESVVSEVHKLEAADVSDCLACPVIKMFPKSTPCNVNIADFAGQKFTSPKLDTNGCLYENSVAAVVSCIPTVPTTSFAAPVPEDTRPINEVSDVQKVAEDADDPTRDNMDESKVPKSDPDTSKRFPPTMLPKLFAMEPIVGGR
jgi:hypothetical protein